MAKDRSLKQQMDHFLAVNAQRIRQTGEAILEGRWAVFDSFARSLSESKITVSIRDTLMSSSESRASFENIVGDLFGDEFAARAFKGMLSAAVGAMLTLEAGAIAATFLAALGSAGTAIVFLIGVALIVWGLAQLLPRVFDAASSEILKHLSELQ